MNSALIVENEPLMCGIYQNVLKVLFKEGKIPYYQSHVTTDTDDALCHILERKRMQETLDFCLLDYGMSNGIRLESAKSVTVGLKIRALFPQCKILMTSSISESYALHSVLNDLNPDGFLIKGDVNLEGLKHSIVAVLNGQIVYSKKVKEFMRKSTQVLKNIDERDWRILQLMAKGMPLPQIAHTIGLSLSGVEYRKRKIAHSLGAPSSKVDELLQFVRTELNLFS